MAADGPQTIRPAVEADRAAIGAIIAPIFAAGETYAIDRDLSPAEALAQWFADGKSVFVAEDGYGIAGTYYLKRNQAGGGSHVANCGYAVAEASRGQGVARRMADHSFGEARQRGFRAMQFNCVVESNVGAVRLWRSLGFETVGRLPQAFRRPDGAFVDALVMWRDL